MVAVTSVDLGSSMPRVALHHPAGMRAFDLADIKQGKYAFLRDMPPCPPEDLA
jgi:hypothetical protein